jgi:AcrR family transcriptional regulator
MEKKSAKRKKKISTKQLLIETAGELFAENGMKGTSIKMIAERSKQNIAAANYHFGSKKNLFVETLRFVVDKVCSDIKASEQKINKKNYSAELEKFVKSRCKILLSRSTPSWYGGLMVRALNESPKPVQEIALEFFTPDIEFLEKLAKAAKPKLKTFAAKLWAYSVVSQIIFYISARRMILLANNRKQYSNDFIADVSDHIIKVSLAGLKA